MIVSKEWLYDEIHATEERIKILEEYCKMYNDDSYLLAVNFLKRYIRMCEDEMTSTE